MFLLLLMLISIQAGLLSLQISFFKEAPKTRGFVTCIQILLMLFAIMGAMSVGR